MCRSSRTNSGFLRAWFYNEFHWGLLQRLAYVRSNSTASEYTIWHNSIQRFALPTQRIVSRLWKLPVGMPYLLGWARHTLIKICLSIDFAYQSDVSLGCWRVGFCSEAPFIIRSNLPGFRGGSFSFLLVKGWYTPVQRWYSSDPELR